MFSDVFLCSLIFYYSSLCFHIFIIFISFHYFLFCNLWYFSSRFFFLLCVLIFLMSPYLFLAFLISSHLFLFIIMFPYFLLLFLLCILVLVFIISPCAFSFLLMSPHALSSPSLSPRTLVEERLRLQVEGDVGRLAQRLEAAPPRASRWGRVREIRKNKGITAKIIKIRNHNKKIKKEHYKT